MTAASYLSQQRTTLQLMALVDQLQPHIPQSGGRRFKMLGAESCTLSMREILSKFRELTKSDLSARSLNQAQFAGFLTSVSDLNDRANHLLGKQTRVVKFKTFCRSLSSNILSSRQKELKSIQRLFKLFQGPLDGVYNQDYFEALNAGQPKHLNRLQLQLKFDSRFWNQMKSNYEAFCDRLWKAQPVVEPNYLIPPVVHLIYIGKAPDAGVLKVRDSWQNHHPDWTVKLWTDQEALPLIQKMSQKFPKVKVTWDATEKQAEKADVLRYCILYDEGGVYADTDLPCYGHVRDLHLHSNFYAAQEQTDYIAGTIYVGNALIAAKPRHPILEDCLKSLRPRTKGESRWAIIGRTGPGLLSRQVYKALFRDRFKKTNETLILPPSYFYSLRSGDRGKAQDAKFVEGTKREWTKGIHLWNLSWW